MKKTLLVIALLAIITVAGAWQAGKTGASSEAGIKARCDAFAAAWNKHDPAAMAACWSVDGDLINPFGRVAKGRAAIEQLFKDEHKVTFASSHFEQTSTTTRTLGDGSIAMVDWEITVTGAKSDDGAELPATNYHCAVVMQKAKDGSWWFEAGRPYVFMSPPRGKPAAK